MNKLWLPVKFRVCQIIFVTFVISVAAAGQQKGKSDDVLDYCSVIRSADSYSGRFVKVHAFMTWSTIGRVDGGDPLLYSPSCNNGDFFSVVRFKKRNPATQRLGNLKPNRNYIFAVVITGKLDSSKVPLFGHLSWALNEIEIVKVNSLVNVTGKVKKPDYAADALLTGEGNYLQTLNNELILYVARDSNEELSKNIAEDLVFVDPAGTRYRRDQISALREHIGLNNAVETLKVGLWSFMLRYEKGKYYTYGFLDVKHSTGEKKQLTFECTFRRQNDDFALEKVRFISDKKILD
jgi:hypothetical protein